VSPRRLVALYPAAWRDRYGDEFLAVLERRPPRRFDVIDIAWGALDAHLFPQAPEGRFRMFTRFAGLAAIGAGAALSVGFWGLNEITVPVFYVLAIVGLVGIHLRQVSVRPGLAWFGFLVALLALVWGIGFVLLTKVGVIPTSGGEFGYFASIALWIGSATLGAVMLAIRVFPTVAGLAFTIAAPVAMIGLLAGRTIAPGSVLEIVSQVGLVIYALAWIVVGWSLLAAQPQEGVLDATG
jgi:hypothetical protein